MTRNALEIGCKPGLEKRRQEGDKQPDHRGWVGLKVPKQIPKASVQPSFSCLVELEKEGKVVISSLPQTVWADLTVNVGQREAWEGASYEGDLYKKYETGSTIRYKLGGHFQCQVYALAHNKF